MQLICYQNITSYAPWKAAFDADDEARRDAGLTVLQIWRDADSDTHAFILLQVSDRSRAQAWIDRSAALSSDDGATVTHATAYFIETA
ncbi:hypothetical protein C1J03_18245 [Sulfitobacter sp. SK012]|uniref:hypothetical protein n=1 Tax=Sulfitobacter sp. SK012 TaxID=1389005 RepID=UPI000E0B907A|nr:hypothetical protein [Sulfitobacter sp. SK012]AXI47776.1 hypothetical protein C1J03_18245 [Sulfitobacter sp. SK012]